VDTDVMPMVAIRIAALVCGIASAAGHAGLVMPGPRNSNDRFLPEFGDSTQCNCVRADPGQRVCGWHCPRSPLSACRCCCVHRGTG
jgi:hypothetical protein